jgi:hypothetical protein
MIQMATEEKEHTDMTQYKANYWSLRQGHWIWSALTPNIGPERISIAHWKVPVF